MEQNQITELLQCPVCFTQYDNKTHEPYILHCGHSICHIVAKKLFSDGVLVCPLCKRQSNYKELALIAKNYSLIELVNVFQKEAFINYPKNPFKGTLEVIPKLIKDIKKQNEEIETYFKQIVKHKEKIVSFNNNLIRILEIYALIQEKPQNIQTFNILPGEKIQNLNHKNSYKVEEEINKERGKIQQEIEILKLSMIPLANFRESLSIKSCNFIEEKAVNLHKINHIELLLDYIRFTNQISDQIDLHGSHQRNYQISKQNNVHNILEILTKQDQINNGKAQLILGFLHYQGIIVKKNRDEAFRLFERAANNNEARGHYFSNIERNNLQYLYQACSQNYHHAFNSLGVDFQYQKFSKYEMRFLLQKIAAEQGSTWGKNNIGWCYEKGSGVLKDLDKAAKWYYDALVSGNLTAKKDLDNIFDKTQEFKKEHPDYRKWNEDYRIFLDRKIILL